jgi:hypothetical protein
VSIGGLPDAPLQVKRHNGTADCPSLPEHPAIGFASHPIVDGVEGALPVLRGKVAKDRTGFPKYKTVVDNGRDEAVGVEFGIVGIIQSAEAAAFLDQGLRQAEFFGSPEDFLHAARVVVAVDRQHLGTFWNCRGQSDYPGRAIDQEPR